MKDQKEKEEILQIPATISKIVTMGFKSLRLQIDTQENLSEEQMQKIMPKYDQLGYFTFLIGNKISPDLLLEVPDIVQDNKKTPSQRMRNVLYILWKESNKNVSFDIFYINQMEKIIEWLKRKINSDEKEEYE